MRHAHLLFRLTLFEKSGHMPAEVLFIALAHPARIQILQFLASRQECYFGDIHDELPIAKATVSQHLKELKDAGLIQGTIEAPKVRYCINRDNWQYAHELFCNFFSKEIKATNCSCEKQ